MFLSVNKKIVYSITLLLILTSSILTYSFYKIYFKKILDQKEVTLVRDSQNISTSYENMLLKNELLNILLQNKNIERTNAIRHLIGDNDISIEKQQEALELEKQKTLGLMKDYDEKYSTMNEAIKVLIASAILIFIFIMLLWLLLKRWVIAPLDTLSQFSRLVSENLFSLRLEVPKKVVFQDEFFYLYRTFNKMLDNIEDNIDEIKSKEEFLQSLIDNIPDGIRVIDEKANIIIANKQYYKQIGCSESHIMKKCYKSSQNLDSRCPKSMFTCPLTEIFTNRLESTKTIQYFANNPNNRLYINSAPLTVMVNDEKQKYIVEAIRDLSEDIRFSHQQKLSSLGFLATAVAHEMKNNLGSIRIILEGMLERIENNKSSQNELKKYLTMVNSQVIESISVPERLLKLSRMPNENLEDVNCFDNINDIVKLLDYEAKSQGVKIDINTADKNIVIKGISNDFKIVIINLLQNAFKAIKKDGRITIEIKEKVRTVSIDVSDNGKGIAAKDIKYIFDPFYSEGKIGKGSKTGTGLGLSIVKTIVDNFNGKIKVKSKKDIGTTFTMSFPSVKKRLHN
ncbi:MAG: GHKL domain-containing protein [Lactobacillaceae bacterium]|nr:GHKL domain-containing protein [Lactobacillaceae bacterium]